MSTTLAGGVGKRQFPSRPGHTVPQNSNLKISR